MISTSVYYYAVHVSFFREIMFSSPWGFIRVLVFLMCSSVGALIAAGITLRTGQWESTVSSSIELGDVVCYCISYR